jgi:hypothetical protein
MKFYRSDFHPANSSIPKTKSKPQRPTHPSLPIQPRIPETLPELSKLWEEMVLLSGRRAKTLVVIDGLDELPDEQVDNLRFLLHERLPQGVFFVVAPRPGRLLEALRDQASAVEC